MFFDPIQSALQKISSKFAAWFNPPDPIPNDFGFFNDYCPINSPEPDILSLDFGDIDNNSPTECISFDQSATNTANPNQQKSDQLDLPKFPPILKDKERNYTYKFEKLAPRKDGSRNLAYYRCEAFHQGCKARVTLNAETKTVVHFSKAPHTCKEQPQTTTLVEYIPSKEKVTEYARLIGGICHSSLDLYQRCETFITENSVSTNPAYHLTSVQCSKLYHRFHNGGEIPFFAQNKFQQPMLLFSKFYEGHPIISFFCPQLLCHVESFQTCHYDGTFKIALSSFSQCLIFGGVKQDVFVPLVYTLTCSKTEATYQHIWGSILFELNSRNLFINNQAKMICDFEHGMYTPFTRETLNFRFNFVQFCYFHFCQIIRRRFDKIPSPEKKCLIVSKTKTILKLLPYLDRRTIETVSQCILEFFNSANVYSVNDHAFQMKASKGQSNPKSTPSPNPTPHILMSALTKQIRKFITTFCVEGCTYPICYWGFDGKPAITERTNNYLESHNKVISTEVRSLNDLVRSIAIVEENVMTKLTRTYPMKNKKQMIEISQISESLNSFDALLISPIFKEIEISLAQEYLAEVKPPSKSVRTTKKIPAKKTNVVTRKSGNRHLPVPLVVETQAQKKKLTNRKKKHTK